MVLSDTVRPATPAAPQEFQEFLALYNDDNEPPADRLLATLEQLLAAFRTPLEDTVSTTPLSRNTRETGTHAAAFSHTHTMTPERTKRSKATDSLFSGTGGMRAPKARDPKSPLLKSPLKSTLPVSPVLSGGTAGGRTSAYLGQNASCAFGGPAATEDRLPEEPPVEGRPFSGRAGLSGLPQVIQCCMDKVRAGEAAFERPLLECLRRAALPLNVANIRDDRSQQKAVRRVLDAVAEGLSLESGPVKRACAKALLAIIRDIRARGFDDVNPPPPGLSRKRDAQYKCLEDSEAVALIARFLTTADAAAGAAGEVLHCLQALRHCSCYRFLAERLTRDLGLIPLVLSLVRQMVGPAASEADVPQAPPAGEGRPERADASSSEEEGGGRPAKAGGGAGAAGGGAPLLDERLSVVLEIIWNVLGLCPELRRLFGSVDCLALLHRLFLVFLEHGHRLRDKELRNDLVSVVTLIAEDSATHPAFIPSGWLHSIHVVSNGLELGGSLASHPGGASFALKPFATTTGPEDFDLKKQLWHLVYLLGFTPATQAELLSRGVLAVFLAYIDLHCEVAAVIRWPMLQLVELQLQAIHVIGQLSVGGAAELLEANGPGVLLSFLGDCTDVRLRDVALWVLVRVAGTENRGRLADEGAVPVILALCKQTNDIAVKTNCMFILSAVVGNRAELQKQFANNGGIDTLLDLLTDTLHSKSTDIQRLLFSVIDCIWCCVVGHSESEFEFIELEGIHALLDLLEDSPRWVCLTLLSCLEDFVSCNRAAMDELQEWKGACGLNAPQVLIKRWNEDDAAKRASQAQRRSSVIDVAGTEPPFVSEFSNRAVARVLQQQQQQEQDQEACSASGTGQLKLLAAPDRGIEKDAEAIVAEGDHDVKVKIFCIFSRMPSDCAALRMLKDGEKMRLQEILAYASLKRDEVWVNVEDALRRDGTKPIGLDRDRLAVARQAASGRREGIFRRQRDLQAATKQHSSVEEDAFYKLLMKKPEDNQASRGGSAGLSITEAKIKKAQMLKASFLSAVPVAATTQNSQAVDQSTRKQQGRPRGYSDGQSTKSKGVSDRSDVSSIELEVTRLLTSVRLRPQGLVLDRLKEMLGNIQADGTILSLEGHPQHVLLEGAPGLQGAVAFLESVQPITRALRPSPGLAFAARDHVQDQCTKDHIGHTGTGDTAAPARMNRYGLAVGAHAESISLGRQTPVDIVCNLIVNDGVDSKVDRLNLFNPQFSFVGVACAPHALHKFVCIVEYAADYQNKPSGEQLAIHEKISCNHSDGSLL
ncbi:hypothetical protein DIPPA_26681 [Diplonema papillatum]|nr:hypothetical protein DIPPA_26681 [Diplonema papillatum]